MKIEREKIKTWFVTGASSGIGHELCKQLLERGYNVVAVSRRVPDFESKNCLCLSVDVTKPEQIREAIARGIEKFGRIDVLANVAGMSAHVSLEEEDLEHMRLVMETNFFGAFVAINAMLPHFRENKNGTIINCTSMAGLVPHLAGSAYCSSKYALEGLTSVCWEETGSFCRVMALEPGVFRTTGLWDAKEFRKKITTDVYKEAKEKIRGWEDVCNDLGKAIKVVIDVAERKKLPRRLILGKDACSRVKGELNYLKRDLRSSSGLSSRYSKARIRFRFFRKIDKCFFRKISKLVKSKSNKGKTGE